MRRRTLAVRWRPMAEMHDATEAYLETILEIEEEGVVPIRARLVERLGLSAAAVSEQVIRLVEQGYAELLADRTLLLTPSGRELATTIVRRHRLAERLLVDVIGVPWEEVDVEAKLVELLGDPATCPHGNPIPGSHRTIDPAPVLALTKAGTGTVRVTRISEKIETDDEALRLLAAAGVIPGSTCQIVRVDPGGVVVDRVGTEYLVPTEVARLTFVAAG